MRILEGEDFIAQTIKAKIKVKHSIEMKVENGKLGVPFSSPFVFEHLFMSRIVLVRLLGMHHF